MGCAFGLLSSIYEGVAKGAGPVLITVAFLGGIPIPAWVAWQMQTQMRISAARRAERGIPTPSRGVEVARASVGCLAPTLSVFAGLFAGLALFTSGAYHQWIHPEIAVVLLLPVLTVLAGLSALRIPWMLRRVAFVAIGGGLSSILLALLLGWVGYATYPYFTRPPGSH